MAEWSKAVDLSSILRCRRGFEPHSRHFFMFKTLKSEYFKNSNHVHVDTLTFKKFSKVCYWMKSGQVRSISMQQVVFESRLVVVNN